MLNLLLAPHEHHTPKSITKLEYISTNFKLKDHNFWKTIFKKPFLCSTLYLKSFNTILHRTLPFKEWLKNKIRLNNICTYCNSVDSISHFLIDCKANNQFWKSWTKWWHSLIGFNIRDYPHIQESILFGFPGDSDDTIAINSCILYAKYFIYRKKLNNQNMLTIDFLSYLSHLKYILKI